MPSSSQEQERLNPYNKIRKDAKKSIFRAILYSRREVLINYISIIYFTRVNCTIREFSLRVRCNKA